MPISNPSSSTSGLTFIGTSVISGSAGPLSINVSGSYKKLLAIWRGGNASGLGAIGLQFNTDTGTNYNYEVLKGLIAVASASSNSSQNSLLVNDNVGNYYADGWATIWISNDNSGGANNVSVNINSGGAANLSVENINGTWASSAAVTSLQFVGNQPVGARVDLYGMAN
jgi:hypothetical protein